MAETGRLIVPLVSPFSDDTSTLSEVRFARLVRRHLDEGAAGFLLGTEAGEVHALSQGERKQLMEWAVREANGVPVYVNVTTTTTAGTIDLAQHAERHGARGAVFQIHPVLRISEAEAQTYVATVVRHANLPCAFFGPIKPEGDLTGSLDAVGLEETGLGTFAVRGKASVDEFALGECFTSPVAVLGPTTAEWIFSHWDHEMVKVQALFQHGLAHRVGKAWMEEGGLDLGRTRGPIQGLDSKCRLVMDALSTSAKAA